MAVVCMVAQRGHVNEESVELVRVCTEVQLVLRE